MDKIIILLIGISAGIYAGYGVAANNDRQLIDHALYTCSKQGKIEVSFREAKDGNGCEFFAMGKE